MTIRKKLGLGLGLIVSFLFFFVIINGFHGQKASAFTPAQINSAAFSFTDANTIVMKIDGQLDTKFFYRGSPTIIGIVPFNVFNVEDGYRCPTLPPNPGGFVFTDQKTSISIATVDFNKITSSTTSIQMNLAIAIRQNNNCDQSVSKTITVAIPPGVTVVGAGVTPPGSATGTDDACYKSGWALSWIACPVITAAQTAANAMYGFVEDQLKFTVLQNCSTPSCADSLGKEHDSVHSAWNNFRILVSGLVVILLLVMVISQAIGTGPFDAYTVRKMLPRLVMGVILIQISWPVFSWVVNTVDHLGVGLADIMYAPFGGSDALNLNSVMSGFKTEGILFSWVGIPAMIIFGVVAPFIVLGLILTVLVALFVGFLTLLFRKILIILALIFVPVALIAWMMPNDGLRKYWKLWWDNFIKALMMFPLIIAMIAAGRIFAKIGSGQSDFVGFFIVLVGFFGPLFILPKTFKWGGTLMQAAGQGISKAQTAALKKPREGIKGMNERYQGKMAKKYAPGEGSFASRGFRRLQSGHFIPTKRSQRLAIQAGDKYSAEQDEMAQALIKRKGEKVMVDGYETVMRNKSGRALSKTRIRRDAAGDMLDEEGKVTKDIDEAREVAIDKADVASKQLTGVQAMKQMWVDLAEEGRDSHEKKMAIRQLTGTSSWPEIQGAFTRSGKRVIDTEAWAPSITTSPEEYPKVLRSRVDAAPHIVDRAEKAALAAGFKPGDSSIAARDFKSAIRMQYAIEKQMSNEDFATQSDGFWQEAGRTAGLKDATGAATPEALAIQAALKQRLQGIHDIGGPAPGHLLGHLVGGGVEKHVDAALTGLPPGAPGADNIRRYI